MSLKAKATPLTIKLASELSGVTSFTIRAWEKRYGAIVPKRTHGARRLYDYDDVEKLRILKKLVKFGYSIGAIAHEPLPKLYSLWNETRVLGSNSPRSPSKPAIMFSSKHLLELVKNYSLSELNRELTELRTNLPPRDFALAVVVPILQTVEVEVCQNRMTIAMEHGLSAILKGHLSELFYSFWPKESRDKLIVVAGPEGDFHEFGLLVSSILLGDRGWDVRYLGANLPVLSLIQACKKIKPSTLLLGVSQVPQNLLVTPINKILKALSENTELNIWLGGTINTKQIKSSNPIQMIPTFQALEKLI